LLKEEGRRGEEDQDTERREKMKRSGMGRTEITAWS
jgi:hypothetical protein